MSTFDSESDRIKRQRMIADALRQSGNEGVNYAPPSGNRAYKQSAWEGVNKILQQLTGAYIGNRADKQQAALEKSDQANTAQLIDSTKSVEDQGFVRPITDIAGVPNAPAIAQNQQLDTDRTAGMRAAALRGVQYGGTAAPIAGEMLSRDLFPPQRAPVVLPEGGTLIDPQTGEQIARGQPKEYKPSEADRTLINVADSSAKSGYRTIARKDWQGEPLYEKPSASGLGGEYNPTEKQAAEDQKIAQRIYNLDMDPLPTGTRNARNLAIMGLVGDIGDANGKPYKQYEYPARKAALAGFMSDKNNTPGGTVRSFSVMLDHFDTLEQAAGALQNGDIPALNKLTNWFKKNTGQAAPATFEALKANIRGEIVKGITGGPGAEEDRKQALDAINAASSPAAMVSALNGIRTLAGGQLDGLRRSFVEKTGLDEGRFDKLLSPAARKLHGSGGANSDSPGASGLPAGFVVDK